MDGMGFPSCLPHVYPYTPVGLTKGFQEPEHVSKVTTIPGSIQNTNWKRRDFLATKGPTDHRLANMIIYDLCWR